jgi:hypothetical protein
VHSGPKRYRSLATETRSTKISKSTLAIRSPAAQAFVDFVVAMVSIVQPLN